MQNNMPDKISLFHIVHIDRLCSIVSSGGLFCDAINRRLPLDGTTIGMSKLKDRRLSRSLNSHPDLHVGDCVPFYFCPRSVMLYVINCQNHIELSYKGGQSAIIHLVSDLHKTIEWANTNGLRWAFTTSNASSSYFDDYSDLKELIRINWEAVKTNYWINCREQKQAEFLVENHFPWDLIEEIGVISDSVSNDVKSKLKGLQHFPSIIVKPEWYY